MKCKWIYGLLSCGLAGLVWQSIGAETLDPALQARVAVEVKVIQGWAADPMIINAVKAQNASLPPALAAMTPAAWKDLSKLDSFVRSFDKNAAGTYLKIG
jgi:hypothetical protein